MTNTEILLISWQCGPDGRAPQTGHARASTLDVLYTCVLQTCFYCCSCSLHGIGQKNRVMVRFENTCGAVRLWRSCRVHTVRTRGSLAPFLPVRNVHAAVHARRPDAHPRPYNTTFLTNKGLIPLPSCWFVRNSSGAAASEGKKIKHGTDATVDAEDVEDAHTEAPDLGDLNDELAQCVFCDTAMVPTVEHEKDVTGVAYEHYYSSDFDIDHGDTCYKCLLEYL